MADALRANAALKGRGSATTAFCTAPLLRLRHVPARVDNTAFAARAADIFAHGVRVAASFRAHAAGTAAAIRRRSPALPYFTYANIARRDMLAAAP